MAADDALYPEAGDIFRRWLETSPTANRKKLADEIGVSVGAIGLWAQGRSWPAQGGKLEKFCRAVGDEIARAYLLAIFDTLGYTKALRRADLNDDEIAVIAALREPGNDQLKKHIYDAVAKSNPERKRKR